MMEDIRRRLEEAAGVAEGPNLVNMGRLYSEKEVRATLDEHIKMARDLAAISGKDVKIWRVDFPTVLGFVEICVDDMTTNQILFDKRQGDKWRPYAGGGMLSRVDLEALTTSIREVYKGGPEAWAKDPSFRPYR
jgi:hypothetical protein